MSYIIDSGVILEQITGLTYAVPHYQMPSPEAPSPAAERGHCVFWFHETNSSKDTTSSHSIDFH